MDTSTVTISTSFQLSLPTEHNVGTNKPPTRQIFHLSKINLAASRQVGLLKSIPRNQSRKCVNLFKKYLHAAMGHLDQERSSIRSTKKTLPETTDTLEK